MKVWLLSSHWSEHAHVAQGIIIIHSYEDGNLAQSIPGTAEYDKY